MQQTSDTTVTGAQLACRIGCRPSYITQLKRQGRVVPTAGGYLLDASLALYEQTKSPAHAGVAQRHAEARGAALQADEGEEAAGTRDDAEGAPQAPTAALPVGDAARRAKALADKAETDAAAARRDLEISLGQLLRADDVAAVLGQSASTLRATLERLADTLAPQLAGVTDEHRCRELIWSEVNHALEELSRGFRAIAQPEGGAQE